MYKQNFLFLFFCLAIITVSILFVLPFLTSVKRLPVCWDCKGSNDFDIVKNLFFFFFFLFVALFRTRLLFPDRYRLHFQ